MFPRIKIQQKVVRSGSATEIMENYIKLPRCWFFCCSVFVFAFDECKMMFYQGNLIVNNKLPIVTIFRSGRIFFPHVLCMSARRTKQKNKCKHSKKTQNSSWTVEFELETIIFTQTFFFRPFVRLSSARPSRAYKTINSHCLSDFFSAEKKHLTFFVFVFFLCV